MQLSDLRSIHHGEDIWVVGSGATLDLIPPSVFGGRITVGCSLLPLWWAPTTYAVTKYHELARQLVAEAVGTVTLVSRYQHGNHAKDRLEQLDGAVVFDHPDNPADTFDVARHWPTDNDELVCSWSTIGSALHLAAYLGARTIFVAGLDGGRFDGELFATPYRDLVRHNDDENDRILPVMLGQARAISAELTARYGCPVVAVQPRLGVPA